ncbi:MAG: uroporphyrinogen-III synthase [Gammaproteobacteria bacterium]|jgi:uroporphyrinogen-III synthase
MTTTAPLAGAGIVVTRPVHQADRLCAMIEAAGGRALRFPALFIAPPADAAAAREAAGAAASDDWLIFTSTNAVEGMDSLGGIPERPRRAAIGRATAGALTALGRDVHCLPAGGHDSESLLATPPFDKPAGLEIAIVRGEGGRPLLGDALAERGARVHYVEVYRRERPAVDPSPLLEWWRRGEVSAIAVASGETLTNLVSMLNEEGRRFLAGSQLVVPSARVVKMATPLHLERPPLISGAGDQAMVQTLARWWGHHD